MAIDDDWVDRWVSSVDGMAVPMPEDAPTAVVAWHIPDGPSWWVRLEAGVARTGRGDVEGTAVVFSTDAETAAALHRGLVSIEDAVLDGRVAVSGDVTRLPALRAAFDAVAEAARG